MSSVHSVYTPWSFVDEGVALQITPEDPMFHADVHPDDVAADLRRVRRAGWPREAMMTLAGLLCTLLGAGALAQDIWKPDHTGMVDSLFLLAAGLVVLLFAGVGLWLRMTVGPAGLGRAVFGARPRWLILAWLHAHWRWRLPRLLLRYEAESQSGSQRGFPFLVMSEEERDDDNDPRLFGLRRTCVFIAGHAARVERLPVLTDQTLAPRVHTVMTPSGLFVYWAGATLFEKPEADFTTFVGGLIDLAEKAGIRPPALAHPRSAEPNGLLEGLDERP